MALRVLRVPKKVHAQPAETVTAQMQFKDTHTTAGGFSCVAIPGIHLGQLLTSSPAATWNSSFLPSQSFLPNLSAITVQPCLLVTGAHSWSEHPGAVPDAARADSVAEQFLQKLIEKASCMIQFSVGPGFLLQGGEDQPVVYVGQNRLPPL